MKKILIWLLFILVANKSLAQDLEPKSFMFSSMADFTNFPVATATGLPDVSLPLFSVPTASPDFNLDLKLQYNLLSNINANITAGQFGSAWNLNIEGTIAREVNGLYINGNVNYLYQDELYFANNTLNREIGDLYSYNFFGNSGKFYLKKENGIIKAILYESNSFVEIKVNYNQSNREFTSIEILDATGRKFVFGYKTSVSHNVYYTSRPKGDNDIGYQDPALVPTNPDTGPVGQPNLGSEPELPGFTVRTNYAIPFWRNLSLTKIYDKSGNLIVDYSYEDVIKSEGRNSYLKKISIKTIGNIEFENSIGNSSFNLNAKANTIILKNLNEVIINKLNFQYRIVDFNANDATKNFHKILLQTISAFGKDAISSDITEIFYKNVYGMSPVNIDYKGYLGKHVNCGIVGNESIYSSHCILQKIKFNTGGSVLYDFEPNTYSNTNTTLDEFKEQNLDNYIFTNYTPVNNISLSAYTFQVGSGIEKIYYAIRGENTSLNIARPGETNIQGGSTRGLKKDPNLFCLSELGKINTNGITGLYRLPYYTPKTSDLLFLKGVSYPTESNLNKFLYSNGQRIKRIAYFEENVAQTLLQNNAAVPTAAREITFDYSADEAGKISSGKTHTMEQYGSDMLDSYVLYEKVTAKVRGVGKSEYYFNNVAENANFWRSLNVIPKKINTFNNANELLKEQEFEREFKYHSNQPTQISPSSLVSREPIVYKEQVKTKEYINNNVAEFISNVTNDTISRQVIYSKNTNLQTNEISETYNNFIKINKTYVLDKTDNYFNGVKTMSSKNTYDANANLRFQEVSKNNQPFKKVGNENTRFNSRGLPLEYIQPNGTYVTNIYGHQNSKLMAQIVGVPYLWVSDVLMNNINTFSDETVHLGITQYNETYIKGNQDALRINDPNSFITTYIYNSIIGVKSITDPNGDTQTFEYDNQNRLMRIKDHQGNTLNSYQYNFKN